MTFHSHPGLRVLHIAHAHSSTVVRPLQSVSVQWQFEWEAVVYKSLFILSFNVKLQCASEDSMQNGCKCKYECQYFSCRAILQSFDLTSLRSSLLRETRASTRFDRTG